MTTTTTADTYDSNLYGLSRSLGLEWWDQSSCRTVDHGIDFFSGKMKDVSDAKKLCQGCPVRETCLQFALDNEIAFFVFGGLTPDERKAL